jgi:putative redox protein
VPAQAFHFTGADGHRLAGRIELPQGPVRGWAVFAHCFTCGKDNLAAVRIARHLALGGIGVLRFDFAGLGESEGDFAQSRFSGDVRDLIAAVDAMDAASMPPSLLIGHSMGGAVALAATGDLPGIKAVATIAAPSQPMAALHQFNPDALAAIETEGAAEVRLAGRPFRIGKGLIDELHSIDLTDRIARLHRPLLVLHAPLDDTVAAEHASRIFGAARHPKSFVSLDRADHLLTRREDADYVADVIAAWAGRYLPPVVHQPDLPTDVEAEETGQGKFQLSIRSGETSFLADEPVSVGGLGSGPSPYDLLSGALAACTTMTLRLYADQKGWPVTRIRTAVGHRREGGAERPDVFSRRIAIEGPLDPEQRTRMLEIAERCPVHRTLERGARFDTVLGEPPAEADPREAHAAAMVRGVADKTVGVT